MAEIDILEFLWFHKPETNNDKVWGIFRVTEEGMFDRFYCFWGRRAEASEISKALQFLKFGSPIPSNYSSYERERMTRSAQNEAKSKATEKAKKGYKRIPLDTVDTIYPGFRDHIYSEFIMKKLMSVIKNDG